MTRILLLQNAAFDLHSLRTESRRAGVCFVYESAPTAKAFAHLLERRPGAVVSMLDGLPGIEIREIAERARQAGVPLFLVGGDKEAERLLLARLSGLFAVSCRRSRLPWLPMLLERMIRDFNGAPAQRENPVAEAQLIPAADQMREVQKLAVIGRLTGSIVHEINNPLESITNLIYLLSLDCALPEHLRHYVAVAEQELQRVTHITRQTLSFHRETQNPVRVDLSSLLEEVLVLYARRLRDKKIDLVRRYDSEAQVLIFPGEIRQVYANLLANAIDATAAGGRIVLRIHRVRRFLPRGAVDGVRVVVADSGTGIPAEALHRLGQPFFTTKGQQGTGLGLWVSQGIIRRYEGDIQVRSSVSPTRHGTTFSIFLPLNLGPQMVESAPLDARNMPAADNQPAGLRLRANGN
jgi:signal transduction histidine kinase